LTTAVQIHPTSAAEASFQFQFPPFLSGFCLLNKNNGSFIQSVQLHLYIKVIPYIM